MGGFSGAKHSSNASRRWCAANRALNGDGNHGYCRVYPFHESLRLSVLRTRSIAVK